MVEREVRKMPIYIDIRENKVLGPMYERAVQEGRQEGRQEGELKILRRLIEKRFGAIPTWAQDLLAGRSSVELEELSVRVLDALSLEDLLK
jgi:predicted transposase YdaD